MLKKFRRNSKQKADKDKLTRVATERSLSITAPPAEARGPGRTIFDLPGEVRNVIYEYTAQSTSLVLRSSRDKPSPPPALLLVSAQTRKEYVPILLSAARITIPVISFDFREVKRLIGGLYSTEMKALRSSKSLTILLMLERGQKDNMTSLRRWLVSRSTGMDRLPWRYQIGFSADHSYQWHRHILSAHLEAMSQLHHNLDESLQWELDTIIYAFEAEMYMVEEALRAPENGVDKTKIRVTNMTGGYLGRA